MQFGEAEVEDLDSAVLRDKQILWFQVAMDDAFSCAAASPFTI